MFKSPLIIITRQHFCWVRVSLSVIWLVFAGCGIDKETELAWQQNCKEALLNGYTNFKGHYVNVDIALYIFSYNYPSNIKDAKEAFSQLKAQGVGEGYVTFSETGDELVIRKVLKSQDPDIGDCFYEFRFMIDTQRRKITVMRAHWDSEEIKLQPEFIRLQRSYIWK